jgi:hypothetical protein
VVVVVRRSEGGEERGSKGMNRNCGPGKTQILVRELSST